MKNKLVLMLLMLAHSAYAKNESHHHSYTYKNTPKTLLNADGACIQAALICASWACKFTPYNFVEFETDDCRTFIAYNCDCNFSIRLYKYDNECCVDFEANDDSFDYDKFVMSIDSFFLTL